MPKNSGRKVKGGKGFPTPAQHYETSYQNIPVSNLKYGSGDGAYDLDKDSKKLAKFVKGAADRQY